MAKKKTVKSKRSAARRSLRDVVRAKEPPRDLKYRCLIESMTDDPRLLEGARFIDMTCLREQGALAEEALKIIGPNMRSEPPFPATQNNERTP